MPEHDFWVSDPHLAAVLVLSGHPAVALRRLRKSWLSFRALHRPLDSEVA